MGYKSCLETDVLVLLYENLLLIGSAIIKSFISNILYCFELALKSSRIYTCFRVFAKFSIPILTIIESYLIKLVVDYITLDTANSINELYVYFACIIGVSLLTKILSYSVSYFSDIHNENMRNTLRGDIMKQVSIFDIQLFDDFKQQDNLQYAYMNLEKVVSSVWTLIDVLSSISSLIISFFIVVMYNQFYALVVLVFGVPYFCITIQSAKKTHEFHMTFVNSERKKDYLFRTALNPLHTINIKLFNIISFMRNKYFEISEFILDLKKNFIKKMNFKLMSFELMPELAVLLISFSILVKVFRGESGIGDYTFYSSILAQVSSSLGISAIYLMQLHDDQLKINIVRDIIRYTPQITDSGISILTRIYEIEFDDVSFRYPGTDRMILHNISFRIDRKIYLIGKNGSGKSTITKLLLRLYEPTSGRILINGKDISEYTIASVRDAFSVYIQNSSCYAFTLYENIVFKDTTNNTDNLRGEVFSFLEHVIPSSLTNKIPYGLDTHLSREFDSEGVQLSVGEMQIIALARVLFKKNSFFILDEPSSSLDPDIEDKIYNQIEDILSDNPAIIITHRLSNIKSEDVIILVDDGVICGHNTHKNLMTSNSLYKELYEYQMNQYIVVEQNSSC